VNGGRLFGAWASMKLRDEIRGCELDSSCSGKSGDAVLQKRKKKKKKKKKKKIKKKK